MYEPLSARNAVAKRIQIRSGNPYASMRFAPSHPLPLPSLHVISSTQSNDSARQPTRRLKKRDARDNKRRSSREQRSRGAVGDASKVTRKQINQSAWELGPRKKAMPV